MRELLTHDILKQGGNRRTVTLLINDNAADTTTTFLDQSLKRIPFSAIADAQYDSAQAPTGMTTSAVFDGIGDAIQLTNGVANRAFAFGRGDWTVEFSLRVSVVATTTLIDFRTGDFTQMRIRHDGVNSLVYDINGSALYTFDQIGDNTWYHIAISKKNGWLYFMRDGAYAGGGSYASIARENFNHKAGILNIGGPENPLTGWMSNVRITKGYARYTRPYKVVVPFRPGS